MSYIIPGNNVTQDIYLVRTARLKAIKDFIDVHAAALSLPPELLDWSHFAYDIWYAALIKSDAEHGEKEGAYLAIALAEAPARQRVNIIKELLRSRYADRPELREHYNLDKTTPRSRGGMMQLADGIFEMHNRLVSEGDPLVLPDAMMDNLSALIEAIKVADTTATKVLKALFDADSKMLALLYDWARAIWGRYDLRFELIGMVPAKQGQGGGGGGEVPAAPTGFTFEWLEPVLQFSWDAVEGATSYQIAFSEDGGEVWEELYTGEEVGYEYEPPEGMRQYRVRARNADGYGEWSDVVEYEIEGAPPMSEWPAELTGLYANYSDFPSPIIIVGHDGQTGADTYRLKRVKVSIADPDPTNADMPAENFVEGLNEDPFADSDIAPDDKCAYWACCVDAADVEGEWTGPVVGEYPA